MAAKVNSDFAQGSVWKNILSQAEPISNLVGGLASFTTMYLTLYRKLPEEDFV